MGAGAAAAVFFVLLRHGALETTPHGPGECAADGAAFSARALALEPAVGVSSRPLSLGALENEPLPRAVTGPADTRRRARLSDDYLEAASEFDGERGEGRLGWLHLLAAHDLAPTDDFIVEQLVDNYVRARYPQLAIDALRHGRASGAANARRLLAELEERSYPRAAAAPPIAPAPASSLPSPELLVPFASVVGRWDLSAAPRSGGTSSAEQRSARLSDGNKALYEASLRAYAEVRSKLPENASDTGVNHALFEWQMRWLRETGSYWEGFTSIPLWRELMRVARAAADELLDAHGGRRRGDAADLIMWTSVHSSTSVHEPHNTLDSLVGGVYYVAVPPGAGHLALYDPRGLPPISRAGVQQTGDSTQSARPAPPFHRSVELPAKEGVLVLFPGWLVHQVLPAPSGAPMDEARDGYRVSISVNFKGEWQDTTGLSLALPPGGPQW